MILDRVENLEMYCNNEIMKKACKFLKTHDFSKDEKGAHKIEGEDFFYAISEYTTKDPLDGKWESHKRYIDIQYMVKGQEKIGYGYFNDMEIVKYNEEGDFCSLKGEGECEILLNEGSFALFYPQDAHMPGLKVNENENIRKIVLKIPV